MRPRGHHHICEAVAGRLYEKGGHGTKPNLAKAIEVYRHGCLSLNSRDERRPRENCDHALRLLDQENASEAQAFAAPVCERLSYPKACAPTKVASN